MRFSVTARACLLAFMTVALAGCGATSTAQNTAKPTVRIISPVNGAKLSPQTDQTVTVHLAISHFTLVAHPAGEKAGSGQAWIYENRQVVSRRGSSTVSLVLTPGSYTLKAVLVTNGKPVAASAPVVVSVPNPVSCAHAPLPSTSLKAGAITLFCSGLPSGSSLGNLVAGPDGNLWFTWFTTSANGTTANGIGRVTPSGAISVFNLRVRGSVVNLVTGPDGNLWFTLDNPGAIGRITSSGVITVFSRGLPAGGYFGNLIAGPDGDLWFTVNGEIGRITPSGEITMFRKGLPHGEFPGVLTAGPDGNVWFAVYPGATNAGGNGAIGIARITPSGVITVFSHGLPAGSLTGGNSNLARYGAGQLLAGPDGDLWFTVAPAFSSSAPSSTAAIGRITPSGAITVFSHGLPAGGVVGNLVKGPDGDLWFPVNGEIGRITPSGSITVFSQVLPAGGFVGNLVSGPDGNLWFTPMTANGTGVIGRITPSGAVTVFNSLALAAGGGAGNLVTGSDGDLWFLVPPAGTGCCITTTNAIGRIVP